MKKQHWATECAKIKEERDRYREFLESLLKNTDAYYFNLEEMKDKIRKELAK